MKFDLGNLNITDIKKSFNYIKDKGINELWSKVKYKMSGPGLAYNGWYKDKHEADEEELTRQRSITFDYEPLISILVPVYMTPEYFLRAMIESVQHQTYPNWQLCLVDGSRVDIEEESGEEISVYDKVSCIETERVIRQYIEEDDRICYRLMEENLGVSGNSNIALDMAKGEYIAVLKHDDVLTEDALFYIVEALQEERFEIIYGDEDKMSEDGNKFSEPMLKPDFSIDLLHSYDYINHFPVVKTTLAKAIGGFHSEFDGASDYDFILRCYENVARVESIKHINRVIYHWRKRSHSASGKHTREYINDIGKKALAEHIKRMGIYGTVAGTDIPNLYRVIYETPGNPFLSIVITVVSDTEHLMKTVSAFYERVRYSNFEIIVVDSVLEDEKRIAFYKRMEEMRKNFNVVINQSAKNIAALRNYGASFAEGDYILFLDSNVEIKEVAAVGYMLGMCLRNDVGAVSGTLLKDNDTIYQKGLAVGVNGVAALLHYRTRKNDKGYMMLNQADTNHSAVSVNCMVVKKNLFKKVGGFTDKYKTDISGVDFCLKLRRINYTITCIAEATWCYHSYTPNIDTNELLQDTDLFNILWSNFLKEGDPYYNSNFAREGDIFSLE